MSLLKTGAVQVGQSATASNNFHWRNLLDGVFRLTRGNAGAPIADVMLVNADNSVAFPSGVSSGVFGVGQSNQNVTATRAKNTTYTNSTQLTRVVLVSVQGGAGEKGSIYVSAAAPIDWKLSSSAGNGTGAVEVCGTCVCVVPPNHIYKVEGAADLLNWLEYSL